MKAYTHFVADRSAGHSSVTRNAAGVSLPRLPWDTPQAEPQAERKVTTMPATVHKTIKPVLRDAPEPKAEPTAKIVALPGEDFEDAYARVLREDAFSGVQSRPKGPADTNKHVEAGKIGGQLRRESEAYLARRDFIVSLVAKGGSTLGDIAQKYGRSKGSLSSMLPELVEAGRLIRFKRKNVYIYRVASHD